MTDRNQRWTAQKKTELVLTILKKESTLVDVCREHDFKQSEVQKWIDSFIGAGLNGLKTTNKNDEAMRSRELEDMKAKIGELVMENDILKKAKAVMGDQEENIY